MTLARPCVRSQTAVDGGALREDNWPHTYRVLPWLVAAFLAMLWLVPFDAMDLPFRLPVDAKLDRLVLGVVLVLWLLAFALRGPESPTWRRSAMDVGIWLLIGLAVLSILLNAPTLVLVDEFDLSIKKLLLLAAFVLWFYFVTSVMRPAEIRPFVNLAIVLGCITAVGLIYEYRTDINLFYLWGNKLFPAVSVSLDPFGIDAQGRRTINGPTGHPLAAALMMAMLLPFAVMALQHAKVTREKVLYYAAIALILTGGLATVRKTSVVTPIAALLVLLAFRPRQMLRLAPAGVAMLIFVHLLVPGAMGSVRSQLSPSRLFTQVSSQGRSEDYAALAPDFRSRPVLGRGWGTYEPLRYRFVDNQYLLVLIETGVVGAAAYLLMILLVVVVTFRTIRTWHPRRGPPALAAAATAVAFAVSGTLFDVLSFPHAPYLFFFVAGIAVVLASEERRARPRDRDRPGVVPHAAASATA
jgi:O-antigen ligase